MQVHYQLAQLHAQNQQFQIQMQSQVAQLHQLRALFQQPLGLPQTVQEDKIFVTDATGRSFSVLLSQSQTQEVSWVYRQVNLRFNAENLLISNL